MHDNAIHGTGVDRHGLDAPEINRILGDAAELSIDVGQVLTTVHLLLACFLRPCRASPALWVLGLNEDVILAHLEGPLREEAANLLATLESARRLAAARGRGVDSRDLLAAFFEGPPSLATKILVRCGANAARPRRPLSSLPAAISD